MTEDKDLEMGPFENIKFCEGCKWSPPKWQNNGIHSRIIHERDMVRTICPCCGDPTVDRVGRYVFPKQRLGIWRLLLGIAPSVQGWVRWKPQNNGDYRLKEDLARAHTHP